MDKQTFINWAQHIQPQYKPSEATLQWLSKIHLVAIVGPTGVGKTTLMNRLDIPYVLSDVTRPKRSDENDDLSYRFRTDYGRMIQELEMGEYVQYYVSKYHEFYGTQRNSYPESGSCAMAVIASLMPMFRQLGFQKVTSIYVMPPSYIEWMRRIGGVRREDLLARLSEARESILFAQKESELYHFVLNDDLELALKDIKLILSDKKLDAHRSQLAYDTADIILERIGEAA